MKTAETEFEDYYKKSSKQCSIDGNSFTANSVIQFAKHYASIRVKEAIEEKWVSVEDEPKERTIAVLVFNGKAPIYRQCVLQAVWFLQSKRFVIEPVTYMNPDEITHWTPLPLPPITNKH